MYVPRPFAESSTEAIHGLMRKSPLATLVTWSAEGPEANHVPLLLDAEAGPRARLLGHVARANPLWREHPEGVDVLAIFRGPESYISPSWYQHLTDVAHARPVGRGGALQFLLLHTVLTREIQAEYRHRE